MVLSQEGDTRKFSVELGKKRHVAWKKATPTKALSL